MNRFETQLITSLLLVSIYSHIVSGEPPSCCSGSSSTDVVYTGGSSAVHRCKVKLKSLYEDRNPTAQNCFYMIFLNMNYSKIVKNKYLRGYYAHLSQNININNILDVQSFCTRQYAVYAVNFHLAETLKKNRQDNSPRELNNDANIDYLKNNNSHWEVLSERHVSECLEILGKYFCPNNEDKNTYFFNAFAYMDFMSVLYKQYLGYYTIYMCHTATFSVTVQDPNEWCDAYADNL